MPPRRPRVVLALVVLLAALAPAAVANAELPFAACPDDPGLGCAQLAVPLDRSGAVPGALDLHVRRLPAASGPATGAVVALAGGPGQAAAPLTRSFAEVLGPALATRDLLVPDQRGTGASAALRCRALQGGGGEGPLGRVVEGCAAQLGARRGLFRTADSVADLEALRAAAGVERLVLAGMSYGTKVALAYAAAHPERVEALVLDSVVALDGPDALQRSTFAAVGRVLGELCAGAACAGVTRDAAADLARALGAVGRGVRGRVVDGRGRARSVRLDPVALFDLLVRGDLNPLLRSDLPAALVGARRGDPAPLARLVARGSSATARGASSAAVRLAASSGPALPYAARAPSGPAALPHAPRGPSGPAFSPALFLATTCEELALPWTRGVLGGRDAALRAAVASVGPAAFAPFGATTARRTSIASLCLRWPEASPAPAAPPLPPDVPALLLSGAADLRTPAEDAAAVAAAMPRAVRVTVPHTGHSVLGGELSEERCAQRAVAAFFGGGAVHACAAPRAPVPVAPLAPRTLAGLAPVGPVGGRLGRTVAAALGTLEDVSRSVLGEALERGALPRAVGGLRGGRALLSPSGAATLHRVAWIPGVRVSGRVPAHGAVRLRIAGGGALAGRLEVSADGTRVTGRLGGRSVRLVTASAASRRAALPGLRDALRRFPLRRAG